MRRIGRLLKTGGDSGQEESRPQSSRAEGLIAEFENSEKGCWKQFYDDGSKAAKGAYAEGQKRGKWFYWDQQGQKRKEKTGGDLSQGRCYLPLF